MDSQSFSFECHLRHQSAARIVGSHAIVQVVIARPRGARKPNPGVYLVSQATGPVQGHRPTSVQRKDTLGSFHHGLGRAGSLSRAVGLG